MGEVCPIVKKEHDSSIPIENYTTRIGYILRYCQKLELICNISACV